MYDIFISYRRDGGYEQARLLYRYFRDYHLNPFFDLEELRSGPFDEKLYTHIEESKNFVLILSPNCLERCANEGDWVKLEILHAIKHKKNIVPVMMKGFSFPEKFPEELEPLKMYNAVTLNQEYYEASVERLLTLLVDVNPHKSALISENDRARVETLYREGIKSLEKRFFSQAIACFEEIRDIDPTNARSYWGQLLALYKCSSNEELILNASADLNDSSFIETALKYSKEIDKNIYLDVLEKRTENCIKMADQSLKNKDFAGSIKYANVALQKRPMESSIWWTKLLAENQVVDSDEFYKKCVSKKIDYTKFESYKKVISLCSETERKMYNSIEEKFNKELEEKAQNEAYKLASNYITQNLNRINKDLKAYNEEIIKQTKAKKTKIYEIRLMNSKFFKNNFFVFISNLLFVACPFIFIMLYLAFEDTSSLYILGVGGAYLLLALIIIGLKFKKYIEKSKLFPKAMDVYKKISNNLDVAQDNFKLCKEIYDKAFNINAKFTKNKKLSINEIEEVKKQFDCVLKEEKNLV